MVLCFILLRKRVKGAKPSEELPGSAKSTTWIIKLALIDWIGTFLFILGGILILLALNWGPDDDWKTVRVIVCLVIGVIVFAACILWEVVLERKHQAPIVAISALYNARPMLPLELFRSYDICVLQYGCFVSGIVMFVMFYFVALFMTIVSGLPPDQAGIQIASWTRTEWHPDKDPEKSSSTTRSTARSTPNGVTPPQRTHRY